MRKFRVSQVTPDQLCSQISSFGGHPTGMGGGPRSSCPHQFQIWRAPGFPVFGDLDTDHSGRRGFSWAADYRSKGGETNGTHEPSCRYNSPLVLSTPES
jgi:hypothetical protein